MSTHSNEKVVDKQFPLAWDLQSKKHCIPNWHNNKQKKATRAFKLQTFLMKNFPL